HLAVAHELREREPVVLRIRSIRFALALHGADDTPIPGAQRAARTMRSRPRVSPLSARGARSPHMPAPESPPPPRSRRTSPGSRTLPTPTPRPGRTAPTAARPRPDGALA